MLDITKLTPEEFEAAKIETDQIVCPGHFYWFVRQAYSVAFNEPFIDGWHIAATCYHLQALWEEKLFLDGAPSDTLVINEPPGCGKALDVDTPILTTWGWKDHGDLRPGDFVFGPDGTPKRVRAVTPHFVEESSEVAFADGAKIVAGENHLWEVMRDDIEKIPKWKRSRSKQVVKTKELRDSGYKRKKSEQRPDAIPVCEPIQFPERRLLIDPYLLGVWLGDGDSRGGSYYVAEQDFQELGGLGILSHTKPPGQGYRQAFHRIRIPELSMNLRVLGLMSNKHVPDDYLESSIEQRWELLRGLMDTDGTCTKTSRSGRPGGSCSFSTKWEHLADQFIQLACSLGLKAHKHQKYIKENAEVLGPYFSVVFTPRPGDKIFKLTRKQALVNGNQNARSRNRYIESVTPVGKMTVNCIQVEGNIYLAGKRFVATHNSRIACVLYPAWTWIKKPSAGHWFSSFGQGLCDRDALDTRRLITSYWYRVRFWPDVHLMDDQNQKRRFNNNKGGWRLSASIESKIGHGEHPECLAIDDPHDPEQAVSETQRQIAINRWMSKFSTRGIVKGVKKFVIAQRLHEEDLSGYVLANEEDVVHLMLPMMFEPERKCVTTINYTQIIDNDGQITMTKKDRWEDPRTEPGELMWPVAMTEKKVAKLKSRLRRAHSIAGQLQQRPTAPEGDMFKEEWFTIVDAAPAYGIAVRAWDKAATTGTRSDFTAGVLALDDGLDIYIVHTERGKWERKQREAIILKKAREDSERYGQQYEIDFEREGAASGKDAAEIAAEDLAQEGFRVRVGKALGKPKDGGAGGWEPWCEILSKGYVKLVRGTWNQRFIDEHLAAPNGRNDDQIDAAARAAIRLWNKRKRGKVRRDLLLVTAEEQKELDDKVLCERCVGLGCPHCGGSGFVQKGPVDELQSIFDAACAGSDAAELGVRW